MKQYEYKFIQVPVAWNTQGIISRPRKQGLPSMPVRT